MTFRTFSDILRRAGHDTAPDEERPVVCVQGLGFVGFAMAVAVASARDAEGRPLYHVVGLDLPTDHGRRRVETINAGRMPFRSSDRLLEESFRNAWSEHRLCAVTDPEALRLCRVALMSVNLDLDTSDPARPTVDLSNIRAAARTLGTFLPPDSLIIVETTVPPGTCEKVIAPELASALAGRGLPTDALHLAHSYERVMPGKDYLASITNFWRVYAGLTPKAADLCRDFLSTVINIRDYPLTRLASPTASETAKVLENSYRAVNIAFIEEWRRFAEAVGIDLFSVIDAIRVRPTHSNIRQPGFGVGGYCLTKDPLFAAVASHDLFGLDLAFPFCQMAVRTNQAMPLGTLDLVERLLGGLQGRTILLLGVSYRQDIGDSRHSPSLTFRNAAVTRGARVVPSDPLLDVWPETGETVLTDLPSPEGFDAVVFAVPHAAYRNLDVLAWLGPHRPAVVDANRVLPEPVLQSLRRAGVRVRCVGRGDL